MPAADPEDDLAIPDERNDTVTGEKVRRYLSTTRAALDKVTIAPPDPSHLRDVAEDVLDMARSYFDDARHFAKQGELVLAYGAVNYAHGWLDVGARLGLFDVEGDDALFTLSR